MESDDIAYELFVKGAEHLNSLHTYDALDRRILTTYDDTTTTQGSTDALGRLTSKTDQAGLKTQYEYDAL